jgi:hypothetical protein
VFRKSFEAEVEATTLFRTPVAVQHGVMSYRRLHGYWNRTVRVFEVVYGVRMWGKVVWMSPWWNLRRQTGMKFDSYYLIYSGVKLGEEFSFIVIGDSCRGVFT